MKKVRPPIYVVQEHHAKKSGLHWDLRLQVNSVLFSWAIPKGMPEEPGVKRLALRQPDHALSWAKFQGEIREGYGAGTVKLWDTGHYQPVQLSKGKMVFEIKGKRLSGTWKLSQMAGQEDKWFIERLEED